MQLPLSTNSHRLDLPDADIQVWHGWLPPTDATAAFQQLHDEIDWRVDNVTVFGKTHPIPRKHQWFADAQRTYRWSGLTMTPSRWPASALAIRVRLEGQLGCELPTLLANLYRDGRDSMGFHADDEPELGDQPVIASVSLGADRDFVLRHRVTRQRVTTTLSSGSLLVMRGDTQKHWHHSLPKRLRVHHPRINLTYRTWGN